jgi:hypothetical protein
MTMTAEVKVGVRSIISYFLYPITRGFDESIREPKRHSHETDTDRRLSSICQRSVLSASLAPPGSA